MVITERAGEMLSMILTASLPDNELSHNELCLRLDLSSVREGMRLDHEQVGDEQVTYEGKKVLTMDPYTAETCASQLLDCDGKQFILMRCAPR